MTRFTTHFGFQSTAAEVIAGVDLTRRKAIVTGGAAGIGAETVRALAGAVVTELLSLTNLDVTCGSHHIIYREDPNARRFHANFDRPRYSIEQRK
jgi:hypothetical protein